MDTLFPLPHSASSSAFSASSSSHSASFSPVSGSSSLPGYSSAAQSTGASVDRACNVCGVVVCGEDNWRQHLDGARHRRNEERMLSAGTAALMSPKLEGAHPATTTTITTGRDFYCETCHASATGEESFRDHLNGRRHRSREAAQKRSSEPDDQAMEEFASIVRYDEAGNERYPERCPMCSVQISQCKTNWLAHLRGAKHKDYRRIWETSNRSSQVKDGNFASSAARYCAAEERATRRDDDHDDDDSDSDEFDDAYSQGLGYLLIINQEFKGDPTWERKGSEADVIRLHETFKTFNFEVRTENDLTYDDIIRVLGETREHLNRSPDRYSCLAIFVMSHGKEREVMALETRLWFSVDQLPEIFSNRACPGLSDRPRLFFVNACRGTVSNKIVPGLRAGASPQTDGWPQQPLADPTRGDNQPNIADFIICYSTTTNSPSYR